MATVPSSTAGASLFVDTKGQFSCQTFSGKDEDWPAWCIKFESYCELLGLGTQMEEAAEFVGSLHLGGFGQTANSTARVVYALLIAKTEGKALALVMLSEKHNGLEAWRRLKEKVRNQARRAADCDA